MNTINYHGQIVETISHIGLWNQNMGIHGIGGSFFLFESLKREHDFSLELFCEKAYEWKYKNKASSFCSGSAGVNWLFTYMLKRELLSSTDYSFLCSDDNILVQKAKEDFESNNFDFLHGGIGIAWYIIYKNNLAPFNEFLIQVTDYIETYLYEGLNIKAASKAVHSDHKINLSVSHGITSILKYCLECYKKNINKKRSKIICMDIITFLIRTMNLDRSESYFPTFFSSDPSQNYSRLAWCYGDLTTAYIMLQAANCFDLADIRSLSMEILEHAAKRRGHSKTGVIDGGICHGSAGNAYIFHKLFLQTKQELFMDTRNYWLEQTYGFARPYVNNTIHFPQYNTILNEESPNHSLLEGTCGVGLVLSSIQYDTYDWDYCIMLND